MKRLREFIFSRKDNAGLGGGCGGFCRLVVDPCGTVLGIDCEEEWSLFPDFPHEIISD